MATLIGYDPVSMDQLRLALRSEIIDQFKGLLDMSSKRVVKGGIKNL